MDGAPGRNRGKGQWEEVIPWFLTVASTMALIVIAWFLVENIFWFRSVALSKDDALRPVYRMHVHHVHLAMIKRSVGLFAGIALSFLGTAVLFFTLRSRMNVSMESGGGPSLNIATASPGLIAMGLGVVLIMGTLLAKDSFAEYLGEGDDPAPAEIQYVPFGEGK